MRTTRFTLTDEEGQQFRWSFHRDTRKPPVWILTDHTGYERVLASTWIDSVSMIHLIADNHGLKCNIS